MYTSGLRRPFREDLHSKGAPPRDAPCASDSLLDSARAIENAMVAHLSRKTDGKEHCPKLGTYLRARGLMPPDGLKKFAVARPHLFIYLEE